MNRLKLLLVLPLVLALGCGDDTVKPKQQHTTLANNDTPANAITRFTQTYEQKKTTEYAAMFTGDFEYEFSNTTDPDLVAKYSTGWFRTDELASSSHLFQGFTPAGGIFVPAAQTIDLALATTNPGDDLASSDPKTHKVLFTRVDGSVVVPPGPGQTESTTFVLTNNQNALYLVRGDAAVGLDSSQPADTSHWYLYHWKDMTNGPAPSRGQLLVRSTTWGQVKDLYR